MPSTDEPTLIDENANQYNIAFWECRRRAKDIIKFRSTTPEPYDQFSVEAYLLKFRILIEFFCLMITYGINLKATVSKTRLSKYTPKGIIGADGSILKSVRLISLKRLAKIDLLDDSEFAINFEYEKHIDISLAEIQEVHGLIGNLLHAMPIRKAALIASELIQICHALSDIILPVLSRHLFEIRGHTGASEANIAGLSLLIGTDDAGQEWFVHFSGGEMKIWIQPRS
jgi:hypothetical protein